MRIFKTPIISVTNIDRGFSALSVSLIVDMMAAGDDDILAVLRINVMVMAMKRAAGTPLSETSPRAKQR